MTYDVAALRDHFPSLRSGTAHFDGPGGTQTPFEVGAAILTTLTSPLSNRGLLTPSEANAEAAVTGFRAAFADLLGVPAGGIVHGRSATQLTYDLSRALAKQWRAGDEVVVTRLDHDANVRPWVQAAAAVGATVRWIDFDPATGEVDPDSVDRCPHRTHPPRRRHRRVQPDRHQAAAAGDRRRRPRRRGARPRRRRALRRAPVRRRRRPRGRLLRLLALQVPRPALRRARRRTRSSSPRCGRTSCCPPPTRCRSGSSSARCPTSCWPVPPRPSTSSPPSPPARPPDAANSCARRCTPSTPTSCGCGSVSRLAWPSWRRTSSCTPAPPTGRRPCCSPCPAGARWDAYEFLAARKVLAPAGSFYAHEPFTRLALPDTHGLRLGLAPYSNDDDVDRALAGLREFLAA